MKAIVAEESGRYLRELLGLDFTDDQLAIAAHPLAPQLVVAGAGSGKTMVMAARVVHLVAFHGVPPSEILGLTFTNKAAGELAERVRNALAQLSADQLPGDDELVDDQPTVSTYHSYAASIVRDHALRIGREPVTQLLTEASRWQLALRVVRNARGPFRHLRWTPGNVARYLLNLDAEMAEHMTTAAEVRAFDADFVARVEALAKPIADFTKCADVARARDELLELVEVYRDSKRELDLIDYGDQVALAAEIAMRSRDVPRMERDRFRVVVLDEYQDTGVAQRLLLSALFGEGHPVTAVGDPHQAIYGWRGASVGNLLRFPEHFPVDGGTRPVAQPLMTSFRSGGRIIEIANSVARLLLESVGALRRPRVDVPPLRPRPGHESSGETRIALLRTIEAEAGWVADHVVAALDDDDVTPRDVAVLCRRRSDFARLHDAMASRGVPVEVVGLGGLLTMPEVADVVATLRVLVDPIANSELLRLLTGPRWRVGPRDLAALGARARDLAATPRDPAAADSTDPVVALRAATEGVDVVDVVSLSDALDSLGSPERYSPEAYERLVAFRDELRAMRPLVAQPIVETVAEVIRRIGLDVEIEAAGGAVAGSRAANLGAFLDHAAGFTGLQGESDLPAFLAYLEAAADEENGLDVGGVSAADTVKLLTVHKAKGLEWAVVAVPGLSLDVFPSGQGRERWTSQAQVLPYALRGDAADLPADPELTREGLKAFVGDCGAEAADEERRLGYVAFTRAKRLLLASGYWWGATQVNPKGPSPLLEELHALAGGGLVTVDTWADNDTETNPMLG
ncbi:MAG: ATP-dependent helicase, partial [Frankia sp.]|nr:ATP-dependent helicase [Frankia sp.]